MHQCRICNNTEGNITYSVKEMMYGTRKSFSYFLCKSCHCLQIEDFPTDIADFYPADYYSLGKLDENRYRGLKGNRRLSAIKKSLSGTTHVKSPAINMYHVLGKLGIDVSTSILDIGSGSGYFLYPLSRLGYTNLLSLDPYIKESIEYSTAYKVLRSDLSDAGGTWDVVTFCHSFEHIWALEDTLAKVKDLLANGGHCLISIPVAGSLAWKEYREFWYQIDAPRHFYLHSIQSMEILAHRHDFEIVDTVFNSNYQQFYVSSLYKQDIPMTEMQKHKGNKLLWKFRKYQLSRKAIQANAGNQGDQAIFVLKRKMQ